MKLGLPIFILLVLPQILLGQCYPDRHNTSWTDAWISCEKSQNPNGNRGQSHWIAYDFGSVFSLGNMKIWNLNIPEERISGVQSIAIDYSIDGQLWTALGEYNLPIADGKSTYEGFDVTDWKGIEARYVILTPLNSHGGQCVGLSEVRFGIKNNNDIITSQNKTPAANFHVKTYPNPYTHQFYLEFQSNDTEPVTYTLYNVLGQALRRQIFDPTTQARIEISTLDLPAGNYTLQVIQKEGMITQSLVQIP